MTPNVSVSYKHATVTKPSGGLGAMWSFAGNALESEKK
jgi:hypothetical protein